MLSTIAPSSLKHVINFKHTSNSPIVFNKTKKQRILQDQALTERILKLSIIARSLMLNQLVDSGAFLK